MRPLLEITHHEEPLLEFGGGHSARSPKEGLLEGGPYDLRLGRAHRNQVRLGLVGPRQAVAAMRGFLERVETGVPAEKDNLALFPDFPGFEAVFRSALALDKAWDYTIPAARLSRALERPPREAFIEAADLYGMGIEELARRELPVDVAICCIPPEVRARCGVVESRLTPGQRDALRKEQELRAAGQGSLFDVGTGDLFGEPPTVEDAAEPQPEDLLTRNFRNVLKSRAIGAKLPIQLATQGAWADRRGSEDPATRAWNLSVALFYKAGGIPWRADMRVDEACFVGISFHHLRTRKSHVVYSSLAQAFSSDGEGFALRGESVPYDEQSLQPYLTAEKAKALLETVLKAYRERAGRDPLRIVIHKTTAFTPAEREGIGEALTSVPTVQLVTVSSRHDFRLLRQSSRYPAHRGTVCRLGDVRFLFTVGYQPQHLTYPGPHVPVPIELAGAGAEEIDRVAQDLLCLTKMNWNSARSAAAWPVTLSFARKVGGILAELPPDVSPHPSFRYYM
jgi:hypothetical protein